MGYVVMNRIPLVVLIVTILTIIFTITFVITMDRGIDMLPEVVDKCKPDMASMFTEAPNLKQAMIFMSILALILAITHLVFSIMAESSQKCFVVRTPCMLALIILTILLQLAFIVSVALLAMTTALVDAIVSPFPNLNGLVQKAMDPEYKVTCVPGGDDDNSTDTDDSSTPKPDSRRRFGGSRFYPQVNLLQLNQDYADGWLDDEDHRPTPQATLEDEYNDFSFLPAYRAALYKNKGVGNKRHVPGSIYRMRRQDEPTTEETDDGGSGDEDEADDVNPSSVYALLVTALVMNIFIVMLLTFYTIIRATNLATAVCNECCVPMVC